MIEILERSKNMVKEKYQISGGRRQISYNSDGRLVIRVYDGSGDKLVVFDRLLSEDIINFVKHSIRYPVGQFPVRKDNNDDVPF